MSTFDSIPGGGSSGPAANVAVTNFPATQPVSSADGALNTIGAQADAAWSGAGAGSVVAILKKLVAALAGTLSVNFLSAQHVIADSGSTTAVTSLPALPAGANQIGHVVVDALPSNVNASSIAKVDAANGTDVALVAGVATKVVYVIGAVVICGAAPASFKFTSKPAGAGTAISANWTLAAMGGFVWPGAGLLSLCSTNAGEGLSVTTTAAVAVHVVYVQV